MGDYLEMAKHALQRYRTQQHADVVPPPSFVPDPLGLEETEPLESVLKGQAVALYCDLIKETIWLVADQEDALKLGERRGSVYTAREVREVIKITDPEEVKQVHEWKREFNGTLRPQPPAPSRRPGSQKEPSKPKLQSKTGGECRASKLHHLPAQ